VKPLADETARRFVREASALVREASARRPAPQAPSECSALDRLTYPPGNLGHAVQYVYDTAMFPDRLMALGAALCARSVALCRKVLGPTESSNALWIIMLGETGAGKQHAQDCIGKLLKVMGYDDSPASGIESLQSVVDSLAGRDGIEGNPNQLVVIDEVGSFLKRISSAGSNIAEIPGILQTLWGWSPKADYIPPMKCRRTKEPVFGPAFSLFGASTETKFIRTISGEQVSNGFVNRMLLLNFGRGPDELSEPVYSWDEIPTWLAKALAEDAAAPEPERCPVKNSLGELVLVQNFRRVGWGDGVYDLYKAYVKKIRSTPSEADREIWIRAPELTVRVATVVAVFDGSGVITPEHWEWALAFVEASMRQLQRALRKGMKEDMDQVDLVDYLREEFAKKGVLTEGLIRKHCERMAAKDFGKITKAIAHLVEVGDIVFLDPTPGPGRPTRKWQWQGPVKR
jgi:hypothetical protein